MRRILVLIIVSLMLTGCVAVPVYDNGYYYPYPYYGYYGPYPYVYGPEVSVFFGSGFHDHGFNHHGFVGGHGFHGGRH